MRRIVDAANLLFGALAGFYLIGLALRPEALLELQRWLAATSAGPLLGLVGLGLVGGNFAVGWREYRAGGYARVLEVVTEEGRNTVCLRALEGQLLGELQRQADIGAPSVRLEPRGEGQPLLARLDFRLRKQENVMRRVDDLKRLVRECYLRLLPAGAPLEILANVRDLTDENGESPRLESEFAGPKYPEE